jgi:hypothetical protein
MTQDAVRLVSSLRSSVARRLRPLLLLLAGAAAVSSPQARPALAEENQCVACHEAEQLPISLGHSFDEWRVSAHGRVGVTCDKCHGGDATAMLAAKAHEGVLTAADAASRVHPAHIAETCGACHQAELTAYSKTVHAKQVGHQKSGATCLTCHGSMAISLPSPAELRARCATCHDKPVEAQAALALLASAKMQLHRVRRSLQTTEAKGAEWHASALERLHEMERKYAGISLQWHTFEMEETARDSRDLLRLGKLLDEEIAVRNKMR